MDRFIYTLIDPRTNIVRYVGLSASGIGRLKRQTSKHFRRDASHRANWQAELLRLKLSPTWNIVEFCATDAAVSAAEKHWIKFYRGLGVDLTNHMDGGWDGRPDETARAHMRAAHIKTHCLKGHEYTPENTGRGHKPGTRYCKACRAAWFAAKPDYQVEYMKKYYRENETVIRNRSSRYYHDKVKQS